MAAEDDGYMPLEVSYGEHAVTDLKKGEFISRRELAARMSASDVVFVGENHEFELGHRAELMLLQVMDESTGTPALSLEMFERDVQDHLNDYLAGRIDESAFMKNSRAWPNYVRDYKPLVEYARRNSLPVTSVECPRRLAMKVAMRGIEGLTAEERKWVAKELYAPEGPYKERFEETMKALMAHGRGMGKRKMRH
ncbi:MAG: ChaN family lipoprotein [Planctomycetota bacterium]|nr:ChaN family lipoprotein [Planctomycetota bacterium]